MCWAHIGDLDQSNVGGGAGADTRVLEAWELKQWGQEVWTTLFRSLVGRERGRRVVPGETRSREGGPSTVRLLKVSGSRRKSRVQSQR